MATGKFATFTGSGVPAEAKEKGANVTVSFIAFAPPFLAASAGHRRPTLDQAA